MISSLANPEAAIQAIRDAAAPGGVPQWQRRVEEGEARAKAAAARAKAVAEAAAARAEAEAAQDFSWRKRTGQQTKPSTKTGPSGTPKRRI